MTAEKPGLPQMSGGLQPHRAALPGPTPPPPGTTHSYPDHKDAKRFLATGGERCKSYTVFLSSSHFAQDESACGSINESQPRPERQT